MEIIDNSNGMIFLKNRIVNKVKYPEDCKIIQKVLFDEGYQLTLNECEDLWYDVSYDASASWLGVSESVVRYWLDLDEDKGDE